MEDLTNAIGVISLGLGGLSIILGFVFALKNWNQKVPTPTPPPAGPVEHGAVVDLVGSATEFAKALKDLDLSGRLLSVGVLLIGVAAITAGLDSVADAIASTAK
jgi:hypothetical protein